MCRSSIAALFCFENLITSMNFPYTTLSKCRSLHALSLPVWDLSYMLPKAPLLLDQIASEFIYFSPSSKQTFAFILFGTRYQTSELLFFHFLSSPLSHPWDSITSYCLHHKLPSIHLSGPPQHICDAHWDGYPLLAVRGVESASIDHGCGWSTLDGNQPCQLLWRLPVSSARLLAGDMIW